MTDHEADWTPIGKHGPYGTHTNLDGSPVARITGASTSYPLPVPPRRLDVMAEEARCEKCCVTIVNPTTGLIAGDCPYCGGAMVATKGAWSMLPVPPASAPAATPGYPDACTRDGGAVCDAPGEVCPCMWDSLDRPAATPEPEDDHGEALRIQEANRLYAEHEARAGRAAPTGEEAETPEPDEVGDRPVRGALAFFRSCIRSGEDWDATCESAYTRAFAVLDAQATALAALRARVEAVAKRIDGEFISREEAAALVRAALAPRQPTEGGTGTFWYFAERIGPPDEPQHVCGLRGYNPMIDPPCPACVATRPPTPGDTP